jgi:hypothetical protein
MARAKAISITVTGNTAPLRKSLKDADKQLTTFGRAQAQWAQASALAYGVLGSAVGQFAAQSVQAAIDDQKAQALLADQLQKTIGANAAAIKGTEEYISTLMMASNVSDDQLRPALAQLVRATGSLTQAQKLLSLAVDVSVGSGRDLQSVTVALSKAAGGQTSALSRLGAGLSQAALNSGDLNAVVEELQAKFGGAAAAAVDTTAGRVENLSLRFGELKEQLGTELLPVVETVASRLLEITDNAQAGNYVETGKDALKAASDFFDWASGIDAARNALRSLNPFADEAEETIRGLTDQTGESAAAFRRLDDALSDTTSAMDAMRMKGADYQKNIKDYLASKAEEKFAAMVEAREDAQRRAAAAQAEATRRTKEGKKAYEETAQSLREALNRALEDSKTKLEDAKTAAKEFGDQFAYSFGVSLAGAYDTATEAEDTYQDALKDRKAAYDALDVAKQGSDLESYLKAVQEVANAEKAVTDAQGRRKSPAAAFQEQIAAAKTFGANLKTLIGEPYKLGQAGLQQLLDLGPAAGAQVTSDLIAGTAGFSVSDLNTSLADLASVQAGLSAGITGALGGGLTGAVSAAQSQVDALSGASISAPGFGQGMQIVVQTGVGDPVAIGGEVKKVLQSYDKRAGKITVQGPKKKAKKK